MTFKPKRVAPPRIIYDAASALAGQVEASTLIAEDDKDRWYEAIKQATTYLIDGVRWRWEQHGDQRIFVVASKSRGSLEHYVNGRCDCEGAEKGRKVCWHRAARGEVELIEDTERRELIEPQPAPITPAYRCIHCGSPTEPDDAERFVCLNRACGRAMSIELFEMLDAPAAPEPAPALAPAPRPTAAERTGVSYEQAMREMGELFA